MSAQIIILPVIRRMRDSEFSDPRAEELKVELQGARLAKVKVIALQLDWRVQTVVNCLLNQAVDNLDSRILQVANVKSSQ